MAAGVAFAGVFALLDLAGSESRPFVGALVTFLYFGSGAFVVLRWGLVSYVVGVFVAALLMNAPATLDVSALYFGNMLLLVALASWGLYTSVRGKLWEVELLP